MNVQLVETKKILTSVSYAIKVFHNNHNLTSTIVFILGKKPYICGVCNKEFSAKSNLMGHIRTHTGEKPFSYDVCSKRFFRKSDLNEHICINFTRE